MIIAYAHLSFAASYRSEASQQRTQRSVGLADLHPAKRTEAPDSPMSSLREAVVNKFNACPLGALSETFGGDIWPNGRSRKRGSVCVLAE